MSQKALPRVRIGFDVGGTKIEAVALANGGAQVARERVPTPQGDFAGTLAAIGDMLARVERTIGASGSVGIGIPGSISPKSGLVQNANSTWLNGQALRQDLESRLGREVRIANDANCFAISEAADGAAAGARTVFGIILGTGCGAGIVIDGRIVDGPRGIGGEWGHNPLPWATPDEHPGPSCWCGRRGCLETWISGPGMAADHGRHTGEIITAAEIARRAAAGDADAAGTLERHASRVARGLAHVVNLLDPDVIVLGGGLSQLSNLYSRLPDLMRPHIFADDPGITIRPPKWGDASGVRGAAWLWP